MAPQDSFIEEEEDVCPLCIEEFDLSDRNFRPCPCGYQVCQFCFNNIKNNMNGLCPACRRPYDEKTIQWKVVTQEEVAEFRANIQKNQKKRAQEQRQKEVQKREAEKENRKNLIGVRVVQKNLVYITGLAPTVREDELLKTLRKPEFFGQYGNIQKISISNRKSSDGQHHSLGIYVTFERPEEATRCIQAVHGSQNGDRVLKAQHGTTKYCSAWLKNEKCNNPGCMFLHEQGDEEDSYTRQDLSSMNSIHTQRPLPGGGGGSSRSVSRQQISQPTPPPVAQSMARSGSKEGSDNGVDTSALPSSASWARNPQRSRRGSQATSAAASSPVVSMTLPTATDAAQQPAGETAPSPASSASKSRQTDGPAAEGSRPVALDTSLRDILKILEACILPKAGDDQIDDSEPPMFDVRGGEKRKATREDDDTREPEERGETQVSSEAELETTGGSLALGGEPEERDLASEIHSFDQRQTGSQPPIQRGSTDGLFGSVFGGSNFGQGSGGAIGRTMTPQHLASMRSQQSGFGEQMPQSMSGQNSLFQSHGHSRQSSRFSFANDNPNSATNVKLAANSRIMAQQSSMMPSAFQTQGGNQFYGSSMPGPPPGLKSTGTPPNMFGQSFGGSGFGAAPKESSNDLLQSLIGRNRGGNTQPHDSGKLDDELPSLDEATNSVDALVSDEPRGVFAQPKQTTSTVSSPTVPPGFAPLGPSQALSKQPTIPAIPARSRPANIIPAIPKIPPAGLDHGAVTPEQTPRKGLPSPALASETKFAGPVSSQPRSGLSQGSITLQDEDFPALDAPKAKKSQPASPAIASVPTPKGTPAPKKSIEKFSNGLPELSSPVSAPSPAPGSRTGSRDGIDRSEPTNKPATLSTKHSPSFMEGSADPATVLPPPSGNAVNTLVSPVQRSAPRSIRVMPMAKSDGPALPSPAHSVASKAISVSHRPETPGSEMVSDSASVLSASVSASRAGSPPPSRVGSASVRSTTKSQQRKQRKEALKQETKILTETPKAELEEHAPVIGRKKKQKKEKPAKTTLQSRSDSGPEEAVVESQPPAKSRAADTVADKAIEDAEAKAKGSPQKKSTKGRGKGKEKEKEKEKEEKPVPKTAPSLPSPEMPAQPASPVQPAVTEKPPPGPASVLTEIRNTLWTAAIDKLQMLRPIASGSSRQEHGNLNNTQAGSNAGFCKDCSCKCGEIHDEDLLTLRAGKPVRKQIHVDGTRMMITPNGDCIRGLTAEEEDTFLELQAAIAATAENPGAFVAPRHQPGSGAFSLIKGRAVPNGRPNIFPATAQPHPQDPIGKLQREDALSYINQYVLPRLNLGVGNIGLPKGASPMRDSAAASLNSLAPYFYGPDAAAGVGIYSAPDGARAMQDFAAPAAVQNDEGAKVSGGGSVGGGGGMPLMSVEDAEVALATARKETDKLEKGLNAVIKRNRRLLLGGGN
ncbi:hypothetical protein HIM_03840 [Hirsutella minnesotensis 3608]|uniref:RING-type domain-containing protein n=1 Tax=Hirsutella minnesotensis 3608 TaxID=1043627 RepID=A0A0F7ZVP3_9HYPO|nr:hypothetical protein HIM_03840 [Hirsutella minnesotensis 3608]